MNPQQPLQLAFNIHCPITPPPPIHPILLFNSGFFGKQYDEKMVSHPDRIPKETIIKSLFEKTSTTSSFDLKLDKTREILKKSDPKPHIERPKQKDMQIFKPYIEQEPLGIHQEVYSSLQAILLGNFVQDEKQFLSPAAKARSINQYRVSASSIILKLFMDQLIRKGISQFEKDLMLFLSLVQSDIVSTRMHAFNLFMNLTVHVGMIKPGNFYSDQIQDTQLYLTVDDVPSTKTSTSSPSIKFTEKQLFSSLFNCLVKMTKVLIMRKESEVPVWKVCFDTFLFLRSSSGSIDMESCIAMPINFWAILCIKFTPTRCSYSSCIFENLVRIFVNSMYTLREPQGENIPLIKPAKMFTYHIISPNEKNIDLEILNYWRHRLKAVYLNFASVCPNGLTTLSYIYTETTSCLVKQQIFGILFDWMVLTLVSALQQSMKEHFKPEPEYFSVSGLRRKYPIELIHNTWLIFSSLDAACFMDTLFYPIQKQITSFTSFITDTIIQDAKFIQFRPLLAQTGIHIFFHLLISRFIRKAEDTTCPDKELRNLIINYAESHKQLNPTHFDRLKQMTLSPIPRQHVTAQAITWELLYLNSQSRCELSNIQKTILYKDLYKSPSIHVRKQFLVTSRRLSLFYRCFIIKRHGGSEGIGKNLKFLIDLVLNPLLEHGETDPSIIQPLTDLLLSFFICPTDQYYGVPIEFHQATMVGAQFIWDNDNIASRFLNGTAFIPLIFFNSFSFINLKKWISTLCAWFLKIPKNMLEYRIVLINIIGEIAKRGGAKFSDIIIKSLFLHRICFRERDPQLVYIASCYLVDFLRKSKLELVEMKRLLAMKPSDIPENSFEQIRILYPNKEFSVTQFDVE